MKQTLRKLRRLTGIAALVVLVPVLGYLWWGRIPAPVNVTGITLPPGFEIELFAGGIPGARSLALGTRGTVFAASRDEGVIYAIRDTTGDRKADEVLVLVDGLTIPNGVAFSDPDLYIAEMDRIVRLDSVESRLHDPSPVTVLRDDLPDDTWHGWRYLAIGPDNMLYVSIGAPCNVCDRDAEGFGVIVRMERSGANMEVVARGVRNSVGFDWHPGTGELWFTDNGRDWLGNNDPPDELNRLASDGSHFGFPFCHAGRIADPEFGDLRSCDEFTPPAVELGPHVAPLGMRFYDGSMFPAQYRGVVLIAEHGSWNRVPPIGYRVTTVRPGVGGPDGYRPFAEGWLSLGRVSGRPVDVLVYVDGSLLVSDDMQGAIYRISYSD